MTTTGTASDATSAGRRTRLNREDRRAQLLAIGKEQVRTSSFDALSVDDVAAEAGISRGLLFHYFPTRADFLVELAREGADELLAATAPDASLAPLEQLRDGLDRYLDYITSQPQAYLSLIRGALGGDEGLREVYEASRAALAERIIVGLGLTTSDAPGVLVVAVRGYLGFVEEAAIAWLTDQATVSRDELRDLCIGAATGMVEAALGTPLDDL